MTSFSQAKNWWWMVPSGVRGLLLLLAFVYVVGTVGSKVSAFNLAALIGLKSVDFWHGHWWTLLTFWVLPTGLADFLFNGLLLAMLGGRLERGWSRIEFWTFFLIGVVGSGAATVLINPSSDVALLGIVGGIWGLLTGWLKLFGDEPVQLLGVWSTTVRRAILVMAGASIVMVWVSGGSILDLLTGLSGALAGWVYLTVRWRLNPGIKAQTFQSDRVRKLEL